VRPGPTLEEGLEAREEMFSERISLVFKKLRVVRTDSDRNLLLVKGTLPGARGALILVRKA